VLLTADHRAAVDRIHAWGQPCRAEAYEDRRWVEGHGGMVIEVHERVRYVPCEPDRATHIRVSRWVSGHEPRAARGTARVDVTALGQWCGCVVHSQRRHRGPRSRGWFSNINPLAPCAEDGETRVYRLMRRVRE
jgi:hypothetical protein